jgi:hypothetical protein
VVVEKNGPITERFLTNTVIDILFCDYELREQIIKCFFGSEQEASNKSYNAQYTIPIDEASLIHFIACYLSENIFLADLCAGRLL